MIASTWRKMSEHINLRSLRERALLLVTGSVLLIGGVFHFFIFPWQEQAATLTTETQSLNKSYQAAKLQTQTLENRIGKDVIATKMTSSKQTMVLLAPQEVSKMLSGLFDSRFGLTLAKVETQPLNPVPHTIAGKRILIYPQEIRMSFTGDLNQLQQYLLHIESHALPILWKSLSYQVSNAQNGAIQVVFIVFSQYKNWVEL